MEPHYTAQSPPTLGRTVEFLAAGSSSGGGSLFRLLFDIEQLSKGGGKEKGYGSAVVVVIAITARLDFSSPVRERSPQQPLVRRCLRRGVLERMVRWRGVFLGRTV